MKRKTEVEYQELANSKELILIGDVPRDTKAKTIWHCTICKHYWNTSYVCLYNSVYGCPICAATKKANGTSGAGVRKYNESHYTRIAKERRYVWLGELPKNVNSPCDWLCSNGHAWRGTYTSLSSGSGCSICGHIRTTESLFLDKQDYINLAASVNLQWLGKETTYARDKTLWGCPKGHTFKRPYTSVKLGQINCPTCFNKEKRGQSKRVYAEDYHKLAETWGYLWVDTELPKGTRNKSKWLCPEGHLCLSCYNSMLHMPRCATCTNNLKKTETDYRNMPKVNTNIKAWRGDEIPKNTNEKTLWECINGHLWEAVYHNIANGQGCPLCINRTNGQNASKPQEKLAVLVGGISNYRVGRKSIDVAFPDEKIAIEYDSWYWHGDRDLQDTRRADELLNSGWKLLRIFTRDIFPEERLILKHLSLLRQGMKYTEIRTADWGIGPYKKIENR